MVTGKTNSGFEFTVNEKKLEDWRFTKAITQTQSGEADKAIKGMVEIAELILGDQEKKLCAHVMDEEGCVSTKAFTDELKEIIRIAGEKNNEVKN